MPNENVPEWIQNCAEQHDLPTRVALRLEIGHCIDMYGLPLPEKDPVKEQRRIKACANVRVLNAERFVGANNAE